MAAATFTRTDEKEVLGVYEAPDMHWVGDGFPVRSLFSYHEHGEYLSPFLLFDYASPTVFPPAEKRRGVGPHPHRGFETVTIIYQGEVAHRDSSGAGGMVGPGDVQWMTAASGVLHDEFHTDAFTKKGGTFEVVQLWVNLPAKDKMSAPRYQTLRAGDIPTVALENGAGRVRVIAGEFAGAKGPAETFTPVNVWDVRLEAGARVVFPVPDGHTTALAVLHGDVRIGGTHHARETDVALFSRDGRAVEVETDGPATLLLLTGAPLDEPVAGYGPFVMNTETEIRRAIADYNSGRFGRISD